MIAGICSYIFLNGGLFLMNLFEVYVLKKGGDTKGEAKWKVARTVRMERERKEKESPRPWVKSTCRCLPAT